MGSRMERTRSKVVASRPSEVADCGVGWAKLQQLVDPVTDHTIHSSSAGKSNLSPLIENTCGG